MLGVMTVSEAMSIAVRAGLDLVEVSPNAEPPVCRVMDFGKFKYEQARKEREARKHQHAAEMKEIKFHANVADHDFETKMSHIRGFIQKGMKVKCSLYFRGRENAHRELGFEVMNRVVKGVEEMAAPDMPPKLMGNSIVMVLGPRTGKPVTRDQAPARPAGFQSPLPIPPPKPVPVAGVVPGPVPVKPA
jgi:translation initiation factor IF-3